MVSYVGCWVTFLVGFELSKPHSALLVLGMLLWLNKVQLFGIQFKRKACESRWSFHLLYLLIANFSGGCLQGGCRPATILETVGGRNKIVLSAYVAIAYHSKVALTCSEYGSTVHYVAQCSARFQLL